MRKQSIVFSPAKIGTVEIKNRLIRSATYENAASTDGEVTDTLERMYRDLAQGGVGLIITGILGVQPENLLERQMRIDDDSFIPGLRRLTRVVHSMGNGCKIMAQLQHPGRQVLGTADRAKLLPYVPAALGVVLKKAHQAVQSAGITPPVHTVEPVAPSALYDSFMERTPRELTVEDIKEIVTAFAEGVRRSKEAGFDGVQLHAAHGWLLSEFLSPHTNRRKDQYGGSLENRTRIFKDIINEARPLVGNDFPIWVKINSTDMIPGGVDLEQACAIAQQLADMGYAALETSGCMWETLMQSEEELGFKPLLIPESRVGLNDKTEEAYFAVGAEAVKNKCGLPVALVGGLKSIDIIEEILRAGKADFVSLSRALIREPNLPNRWLRGEGSERADCVSCNACLPLTAAPLQCMVVQESGE